MVDASAVTGDLTLTGNTSDATTFKLGGVGDEVSVSATGGTGADTFEVGGAVTGTLTIYGGTGTGDILNFTTTGTTGVTVKLADTAAAGTIGVSNVETINGTANADSFDVTGLTGDFALNGGEGTDTVKVTGNTTVDLTSATLTNIETVDAKAWSSSDSSTLSLTGDDDGTTFQVSQAGYDKVTITDTAGSADVVEMFGGLTAEDLTAEGGSGVFAKWESSSHTLSLSLDGSSQSAVLTFTSTGALTADEDTLTFKDTEGNSVLADIDLADIVTALGTNTDMKQLKFTASDGNVTNIEIAS